MPAQASPSHRLLNNLLDTSAVPAQEGSLPSVAKAITGQVALHTSFARHALLAAAAIACHIVRFASHLRVLRCLALSFCAIDIPAILVEDLLATLQADLLATLQALLLLPWARHELKFHGWCLGNTR